MLSEPSIIPSQRKSKPLVSNIFIRVQQLDFEFWMAGVSFLTDVLSLTWFLYISSWLGEHVLCPLIIWGNFNII